MDKITKLEASVPDSLTRDSSGLCLEENTETKSSCNDEENSDTFNKTDRNKSLNYDFDGFPSSESHTTSVKRKSSDTETSNTCKRRNLIVKIAARDKDSLISSDKLGTEGSPHISPDNETKPYVGDKELFPTRDDSSHSNSVKVTTYKSASSSLHSEPQSIDTDPERSSQDDTSSGPDSKTPCVRVARWLKYISQPTKPQMGRRGVISPNTASKKICEIWASKPDANITYESETEDEENIEDDKPSGVEGNKQTSLVNTQRTYSGPLKRRFVRTKDGERKSIIIVKKDALRNLQSKGVIQPIRKYIAGQQQGSEPIQNLNVLVTPQKIVTGKNNTETAAKDVALLKGSEPVRRDSHTEEKIKCESQKMPGTRNFSTQTVNLDKPIAIRPFARFCYGGPRGLKVSPSTFNIHLPPRSDRPLDTKPLPHQHTGSMRSVHPTTNELPKRTVSEIATQTEAPPDTGDPLGSHVSDNAEISGKPEMEVVEAAVNEDAVMGDISQAYGSTSPSPPPGHETPTTSQIKINSNETKTVSKHSLIMSPIENTSTATCISKTPTVPTDAVAKNGIDVNKSESSTKAMNVTSPDEEQLSKTRPQPSDNGMGAPMHSSTPNHQVQPQPQPSSSGITPLKGQINSSKLTGLPTITLSSAEKPGVVYKAIPLSSLVQKGQELHITPQRRATNMELKSKYTRLLRKHRCRYHVLLKKYKDLQERCSLMADAGTPQQIMRDARKYMTEERALFLESQMFLKNRPGTGNRFSKKFMKLMISYYNRSKAGYRFLKTIFTLPSLGVLRKWLSRLSAIEGPNEAVSEEVVSEGDSSD